MPGLISLGNIPYRARAAEARERAKWPTRAMALDAASFRILHGPPTRDDIPAWTLGFVLTLDAAEALSETYYHKMPGKRHPPAYEDGVSSSEALGLYMEAIARGVPQAEALAAYEASIED